MNPVQPSEVICYFLRDLENLEEGMFIPVVDTDDWLSQSAVAQTAGNNASVEQKRTALIQAWMWDTVIPYTQPIANKYGFGREWRRMIQLRTTKATERAADRAFAVFPGGAYDKSYVTQVLSEMADEASPDVEIAGSGANSKAGAQAVWAARVAIKAAEAMAIEAEVVDDEWSVEFQQPTWASYHAEIAWREAWTAFDPLGLLRRLLKIELGRDGQTVRRFRFD